MNKWYLYSEVYDYIITAQSINKFPDDMIVLQKTLWAMQFLFKRYGYSIKTSQENIIDMFSRDTVKENIFFSVKDINSIDWHKVADIFDIKDPNRVVNKNNTPSTNQGGQQGKVASGNTSSSPLSNRYMNGKFGPISDADPLDIDNDDLDMFYNIDDFETDDKNPCGEIFLPNNKNKNKDPFESAWERQLREAREKYGPGGSDVGPGSDV